MMMFVMCWEWQTTKSANPDHIFFHFFLVWKSHSGLGISEDNKILGVSKLADISKFLLSLFTGLLLYIVKLRWDIQDCIQHK